MARPASPDQRFGHVKAVPAATSQPHPARLGSAGAVSAPLPFSGWANRLALPPGLSGVADIVQGQVRPVPCRMPVCYTLPIEH